MKQVLAFYQDQLDWLGANPRVRELAQVAKIPLVCPWLPQGKATPFEVQCCEGTLTLLAGKLLDRLARDERKTYKTRERIPVADAKQFVGKVFSGAKYMATGGFRHVFRVDLSPFSMNGKPRMYILKVGHTLCPATGWEAWVYRTAGDLRPALATPYYLSATVGLYEEVDRTPSHRSGARKKLLPVAAVLDLRDDLPSNYGISLDGRPVFMDYAEPSTCCGYEKHAAAELFKTSWKLG